MEQVVLCLVLKISWDWLPRPARDNGYSEWMKHCSEFSFLWLKMFQILIISPNILRQVNINLYLKSAKFQLYKRLSTCLGLGLASSFGFTLSINFPTLWRKKYFSVMRLLPGFCCQMHAVFSTCQLFFFVFVFKQSVLMYHLQSPQITAEWQPKTCKTGGSCNIVERCLQI